MTRISPISLPHHPASSSDQITKAGIGLKAENAVEILSNLPDLGFLEVHTENYMRAGGPPHYWLGELARHYPLSLHGVGLSLGSAGALDNDHLARIREVEQRYQPLLVSEHVAWSRGPENSETASKAGQPGPYLPGPYLPGPYLNDLLPLPYDKATLDHLINHIDQVQTTLQRRILIENPSTYLTFSTSTLEEPEFLKEAAKRSGCGLLIDVNNVAVNAKNHGWDAFAWLDAIPPELVGEIHLAGHTEKLINSTVLCIDDHGSPVKEDVWCLYVHACQRFGPRPTLIEWDSNIPALSILLQEAERANHWLEEALHAA